MRAAVGDLVGIESDKLVFDYLSRVGDLAHSARMSAAERAKLVGGLRDRIDRERAADGGAQSKGAVQKILGRMGRPEDVVAAANGGVAPSPGDAVPSQRADGPAPAAGPGADGIPTSGSGERILGMGRDLWTGLTGRVRDTGQETAKGTAPGAGTGATGTTGPSAPSAPSAPSPASGSGSGQAPGRGAADAGDEEEKPRPSVPMQRPPVWDSSSPHLAGLDELGSGESEEPGPQASGSAGTDWWRVEPGPYGEETPRLGDARAGGGPVPGFTGGIELPEVLRPPSADGPGGAGAQAPGAGEASGPPETPVEATPGKESARRRGAGALLGRVLGGGRAARGSGGPRAGGFVELAAAALLVAGAVTGSFVPLALGWLAAWWSPKLSRVEAKWAAAGMPGLVLAGTGVWLWGRMDGQWGEPIAQGGEAMRDAMGDVFPVLLRTAAVASALYLVWRARRPAGG